MYFHFILFFKKTKFVLLRTIVTFTNISFFRTETILGKHWKKIQSFQDNSQFNGSNKHYINNSFKLIGTPENTFIDKKELLTLRRIIDIGANDSLC